MNGVVEMGIRMFLSLSSSPWELREDVPGCKMLGMLLATEVRILSLMPQTPLVMRWLLRD